MMRTDWWHRDANRHFAKGCAYLEAGNPEYAAGSFRKAAKARRRAVALDQVFNPQRPTDPLGALVHDRIKAAQLAIASDIECLLFGARP